MHQFNTSISFLSHSILQPADRDFSVEAKGSTQKCAKVSGITTGAADAAPASAMIAACAGVGGFMISASLTPKTRTSGGQGCAPDTIVQGVTYYCKRVADASVQVHTHSMYTGYLNLDTLVCHTRYIEYMHTQTCPHQHPRFVVLAPFFIVHESLICVRDLFEFLSCLWACIHVWVANLCLAHIGLPD